MKTRTSLALILSLTLTLIGAAWMMAMQPGAGRSAAPPRPKVHEHDGCRGGGCEARGFRSEGVGRRGYKRSANCSGSTWRHGDYDIQGDLAISDGSRFPDRQGGMEERGLR
jgi:hypothetical protein